MRSGRSTVVLLLLKSQKVILAADLQAAAVPSSTSAAASDTSPRQSSRHSAWWQSLAGCFQLTRAAVGTGLALMQMILLPTNHRSIATAIASQQTAAPVVESEPPPLAGDEVPQISEEEQHAIHQNARRMRDVADHHNLSTEAMNDRMDEIQTEVSSCNAQDDCLKCTPSILTMH